MIARSPCALAAIVPVLAVALVACQGAPLTGPDEMSPLPPATAANEIEPTPSSAAEPNAVEQAGNDTVIFSFEDGYRGSATVFWYKLHVISDPSAFPSSCWIVPDFSRTAVQAIRVDVTVNYQMTNGFTLPEQRRLQAQLDDRDGGYSCGELQFPVAGSGQTHELWMIYESERTPNQPEGTPVQESGLTNLALEWPGQSTSTISTYPGSSRP